jgi:oligosaccharyltransferase complex subunit gamma
MFTVRTGCVQCQDVYSEYIGTAYSFNSHKDKLDRPVFYAVFYYTKDKQVRDIYTAHAFKTVPYIAASKMQVKRESIGESGVYSNFFKTENLWLIKKEEIFDAHKQLEFVNNQLGSDIELSLPLYVVLVKNAILFTILAALILVVVKIRPFLINQNVWFGISIVSFAICIQGFVYNLLNNAPVFRFEQDKYGKMFVSEYFMRGMRQQYAGEGYIVSTIVMAFGIALLVMTRAVHHYEDAFKRRITVGVGILVCFGLLQAYLACYRIKNPWYGTSFFPPRHYTRGPINRDTGNVI